MSQTTTDRYAALPLNHPERQRNWLGKLLADGRSIDLTAWAIDWLGIDLAALWTDLDDDERDTLVEAGIVIAVAPAVKCTDAESWQSDWREESNAAWPSYDLKITSPGMETFSVRGWHCVGPMGPDGNRQHEEWAAEDSDGANSGLPTVEDWEVSDGSNLDSSTTIPCWRDAIRGWVTLDRDALGRRIERAASGADHGSEPTWDDVDRDDMEDDGTVYVVRDWRVEEVMLLTGGVAGHNVYDDERHRDAMEYYATAWSHSLADSAMWQTVHQARADLRDNYAADARIYGDYDEARAALSALVDARLAEIEIPAGLAYARDAQGLYVEPADGDSADSRYHLDADDTARVCELGWLSIVDVVTGALGRRATLNAAREWQVAMDDVIADVDPWVGMSDSVAGGNCQHVTLKFATMLRDRIQATGDIGAARASVILAASDDAFTRRACRMAAQRYTESHAAVGGGP